MSFLNNTAAVLGPALAAALFAPAASAQAPEGLFAKKTITINIGNTTGGSYDLYGRMAARFLGRHLPGSPNVVAVNMPGAGTLKAANYIYEVAPKDGTALGIVTDSLALEQAAGNPAVLYDAVKFAWIGRMATSNNIHMQWHTAKVQSLADAMLRETPVAAAGAGNVSEVVPNLLNKIIGTKFKVISGYPASAEGMLAMERGEVEGSASSWAAVKTGKKEWLEQKKIKIILQNVQVRSPELPDVPALGELGATPDDKALLGFYASGGAVGRSLIAPRGIQPAALKALQEGFTAMTRDPEFIAEMQKTNLDLEPLPGDALAAEAMKTLAAPQAVKDRVRAIFGR